MKTIRQDGILFLSLTIGLGALAVFLVTAVFFFRRLPPQIPLLYSLPWGEQQLSPSGILLLLPLAGTVILGLISTGAVKLYRREPLLARIIVTTGCLSAILLSSTGIQIIWLTHL
jgi:hypothetical protein